MTQAILGNAAHPEYGVATIPFPIPRTEYANCVALLEALEIGDARDRDCQVQEICGSWPALNRLAQAVDRLSWDQRMKLGAVAAMAECRVQGTLEPEELDCLKDYIAGQTSDGWGEGFEQREIPVADGELYVHLWSFTGWEIQTEEERFSQRQDSPCFEQSF